MMKGKEFDKTNAEQNKSEASKAKAAVTRNEVKLIKPSGGNVS